MTNNVFIMYRRSGYEGCSEPLAVFDSLEKAQIYKKGYEAGYGGSMEIMELEVK